MDISLDPGILSRGGRERSRRGNVETEVVDTGPRGGNVGICRGNAEALRESKIC